MAYFSAHKRSRGVWSAILVVVSVLAFGSSVVQSQTFPAPSEPPGAPFKDPNLKLVVMSRLLDLGAIDLGEKAAFYAHVLDRPFDEDEEGYDLVKPAYDYLVRYPLSSDLLQRVDRIEFDGGLSIYPYIWRFWDGLGSEFDVKSLDGIEALSSLETVSILAFVTARDLSPLANLPKLKALSLEPGNKVPAALLDAPALKTLSGYFKRATASERETLLKLQEKGVTLRSHNGWWAK